ncbi:hypothetical protein [Pseudoduganella sp. HUAS MS19]
MRTTFATVIAAALLLNGCSKIPDEKASYIGTWKSQHATLTITRAWRMQYHRSANETRVEENFNVNIKQFSENEIIGNVGDARLDITAPPHQEGGSWQMTVNGDVLYKQ